MELITIAKFNNNNIVITTRSLTTGKRQKSEKELENLNKGKNGEYNGFMSPQTRKKVNEILTAWLSNTKIREELQSSEPKKGRKIIPTFITLTLCAKQFHTDNFIKRHLLGQFLTQLRRVCGVQRYFWRAETQKNGNIHFHIICDVFIQWQWIKRTWNSILENFGYIDRFEQKMGHRTPNSTDIHSLKNVSNIIAYISKYVTKKGSENECRKVEGRIWGCSDNLKELKVFRKVIAIVEGKCTVYENKDYVDLLRNLEKKESKVKVIQNEYSKVIVTRLPIKTYIRKWQQGLEEEINSYYKQLIE